MFPESYTSLNKHTWLDILTFTVRHQKTAHTLDFIMSTKQSLNSCMGPECHLCCCFLYASYDSGNSH